MTSDSNDRRTAVVAAVVAQIGEFLTVPECASVLRVTPATIYGDIEQGLIRDVIRVGTRRGYRVPVDAFHEYAHSLKVVRTAVDPGSVIATPAGV